MKLRIHADALKQRLKPGMLPRSVGRKLQHHKAAVGHSRGLILTPQVATQTSWGHEYVQAGLAHVARGPEDAVDIASDIINTADAGAQLFA